MEDRLRNRDRIERFFQIIEDVPSSLIGLDYAFAACLTPQELFDALNQKEKLRSHSRHVLLNATEKLTATLEIQELASKLAHKLIECSHSNYQEARSANYILSRIFELLYEDTQSAVISFWLADKYADSKQRFIKLAGKRRGSGGADVIFAYWRKTRDDIAAKHLIYDAPLTWLMDRVEHFMAADLEPWLTSRLLLRLSELDPEIIERIRDPDPITYLYLCAKTGRELSASTAADLFFASTASRDRRGLALWALGTMGHWKTLEMILTTADDLSKEDEKRILARFGFANE